MTRPMSGIATLMLALLGVLTTTLALWLVFPALHASDRLDDGSSGPLEQPWVLGQAGTGYHLDVHVSVKWLTPARWTIIPDYGLNALLVNGQPVPLDRVRPGGLSDWRQGFGIDLSPWLHRGDNELEFVVDHYRWYGGFVLRPQPGWRVPLLAAALLPWLLALSRLFGLGRRQVLLLCVGLAVLCFYWAVTPWDLRCYDTVPIGIGGHLDYVKYVADHAALPRPDQGWEYFQPPLYYIAGALVWHWAQWFGVAGAEALQAFAIAIWLVFLSAAAAALRLCLPRTPQWLAATAALALWPAGIIHGLRLGNDPPLYAAAAVATWFMFRWWRSGRRSHMFAMACSIAVALLCKLSAGPLIGAAAALMVLRLVRARQRVRLKLWLEAGAAAAIVAAGGLLALGRNLYFWLHGDIANWLISNIVKLSPRLGVPDQLKYFLSMDLRVFLNSPWVDVFDDATGRAYFWNFLLRSSLSAEFHFDGALQRALAHVLGGLLLSLMVVLLLQGLSQWRSRAWVWRNASWIVLGLMWLCGLLALRIAYPFSCESDFRLVLPLLIPFLIACARAGRFAQMLLAAIALGSGLFFLTLA